MPKGSVRGDGHGTVEFEEDRLSEVAEIPVNAVPPALSNAIREAVSVRVGDLPITAEKVAAKLRERDASSS